ncbi:uncharacterized protein LOC134654468 [Cydia amplana]|uniref:uncharacterized protein LOC134654468 n=1 Tax=Cydia amplana TaxID=1869771 RepID=UPI002FE676F5
MEPVTTHFSSVATWLPGPNNTGLDPISVEQIKRKWKNLKDNYRKELKKLSTSRSGDPGTGDDTSPWKHFNQMSFLKDDMIPAEGDSNLVENEDEELDVSVSSEVQSPSSLLTSPRAENVSPTPSRSQSPSPRNVSSPRSTQADTPLPSRKRTKANDIRIEYLEIEKKKLKILEDEVAKNNTTHQNTPDIEKTEDYFYLMSILPEMRKLNPIQKMRVRNKINQALMEEMVMSEDPYSHRGYYTQPTSSFTTFNRNEYNDRNSEY